MICPVYIYFVEGKKYLNYDVILITNNIVFKCVFAWILRNIEIKKYNYDDGEDVTVMIMMMHPEIVHEMQNDIFT